VQRRSLRDELIVGYGCTLSAEKFFEGAVRGFCMLFLGLFLFLIVVSFSV